MTNYRFERAEQKRKNIALTIAIFVHLVLLAGLAASGKGEWQRYLPDSVQQWLGATAPAVPAEPEAPRP